MHWSWIDLQYVSQDPVDSDGDGDDEADSNDDDDDDDDDEEADSNDDDDEEEAAVIGASCPPWRMDIVRFLLNTTTAAAAIQSIDFSGWVLFNQK